MSGFIPSGAQPLTTPAFTRGDQVQDRRNPSRTGVILDTSVDGSVAVFFGPNDQPWVDPATLIQVPKYSFRRINGNALLRELALAKANLKQSDQFFSYGASLTEFAAYQFRPVVKFLSAWHEGRSKGILIADEVGLGKTIEAAIIMQELKARTRAGRILVVCPSKLTAKWQEEMLARFGEDFSIWSADDIREHIRMAERTGDTPRFQAIVSLELIRRGEYLSLLDHPSFRINYLIIDESHHMRNPEAAGFRIGALLAKKSDAVVLLSATPVHLKNDNLRTLLRLIAPETYGDPFQFQLLMEPNASINRAVREITAGSRRKAARALKQVYSTNLGGRFRQDPWFRALLAEIESSNTPLTPHEKVDFQRRIASFNTLSNVLNRTRKREFQDVAQREAVSVEVELTTAEKALYDAILAQVRHELARQHDQGIGFAMVMRERQAASCLPAMRPYLEKIQKDREHDLFEHSEFEIEVDLPDTLPLWKVSPSSKQFTLREILALAGSLEQDSKFDHLLRVVKETLAEGEGKKILLFAYFIDTLEYLDRQLRAHGIKSRVIHGKVPVHARQETIRIFRETGEIEVLLSSEVGAEGLDFEFCDVLVNYDLPWNPMAIEQRIGRLDRFNRDPNMKIRILNFFLKDTIETRIFKRLYERINIFRHSIGDLEDILGDVVKRINKDMLLPELTDAQRAQRAQAQLDRIANIERENEEFAQAEQALLGQTDILDSQIHDAIRSGKTISGEEVRALVGDMFSRHYGEGVFEIDDEDGSACIQFHHGFSDDFDAFMIRSGDRLPHTSNLRVALIERRPCPLVFDRQMARSRPSAEFVTIHHPLGQLALTYWQDRALPDAHATPVTSIEIPWDPGDADAWFFIYRIRVQGIQERQQLEIVVLRDPDGKAMEDVEANLLALIQHERHRTTLGPSVDDARDSWFRLGREEMERRRRRLLAREQEDFKVRLDASIASLKASCDAEIKHLRRQMNEVDDVRIKRMRKGEIANKTDSYARRIRQLQETSEVTIEYQCIAGGRLALRAPQSSR